VSRSEHLVLAILLGHAAAGRAREAADCLQESTLALAAAFSVAHTDTSTMGCAGSKSTSDVTVTVDPPSKQQPIVKPEQVALEGKNSGGGGGQKKGDEKRRKGVSAEASGAAAGEYKKVVYEKSDEAKAMIAEATQASALFSNLSASQHAEVVDAMKEMSFKAGDVVIQQGDQGDNFYVVASGEYAAYLQQVGDKPVKQYAAGGTFGELALMYNSPRAASIITHKDGTCWALDRNTFRHILMAAAKESLDTNAQFLQAVGMLSSLTDAQRQALGEVLESREYGPNETIVREGEEADSLYLIKSGEVVAYKASDGKPLGKELGRMRQLEFFGESSLDAAGEKRQATVVTVSKVTMLKLTRLHFTELFGELREVIKFNFNQKVLGSMEIFHELSDAEKATLVDNLVEESFGQGAKVIEQGTQGDSFYIIKTGAVRVIRRDDATGEERVIKEKLGPSDFFGEMALLKDEPRFASIVATAPTTCMKLDRATFKQLLGGEDLLSREAARRQQEVLKASRPKIAMASLEQRAILGIGTFGRVKLVTHNEETYALKCMRKGQIVALKQVEHVMNEKTLLEMCDHPFLLKLMATYQDEDEIYMLLELALGGELFSVLREQHRFEEPQARFYAACVQSAFAYMHDKKIVYRDLKPENLLFDSLGYIKVVDFGFAKMVPDRTWTLCGTPEYLAPEIITNKGHGLAVDWWAFGILIFEMLVGEPPFCADDPMEIYQKILRNKIYWPSTMSRYAKDLITRLLLSVPAQRLGSLKKGHREISGHAFFGKTDFTKMLSKAEPAPYVPTIKSPTDTSNFDDYDDEGAGDWARYNDKRKDLFKGF